MMHYRLAPRIWPVMVIFVISLIGVQANAGERPNLVNTGPDKVAIKGYDPVAYFTEGQPMEGKPEFTYSWNDAQWHFANAAHRDMFATDPDRYAPQFGGHCSMALTRGEIRTINPAAWAIVDGKLYLSFAKGGIQKFTEDTENIEKAGGHWARLQTQ